MKRSLIPFLAIVLFVRIHAGEPDRIIFSHPLHTNDVGAECLDCHEGIAEKKAGGSPVLPSMDVCATCHDEAIEDDCTLCHTNVDEATAVSTELNYKRFSHASHLKEKDGCAHCHIPAGTQPGDVRMPEMNSCLACHNNARASGVCLDCHDQARDIRPKSHGIGWLQRERHGVQSRFGKDDCSACHQQSFCNDCHQGNSSQRIHDPNFRFTHGLQARKRDKNCTVCHEVDRFCSECH